MFRLPRMNVERALVDMYPRSPAPQLSTSHDSIVFRKSSDGQTPSRSLPALRPGSRVLAALARLPVKQTGVTCGVEDRVFPVHR